jgi:heme oxygenase (biliverdin-producing, ferredoxin)
MTPLADDPVGPSERAGDSAAFALRQATAELHRRAEHSPFQRLLVAGRLPIQSYVGWLEQMHCLYRVLEARWAGAASGGTSGLGSLLDGRGRTAELRRDLGHLVGMALDAEPLPATARFLARVERWASLGPGELVGMLYVLEGSTNGSRHIARVLRRVYPGLQGPDGLAFLEPYGEGQPERWRQFKTDLDRALTPLMVPAAIAGACATFEAVTEIGRELLARAEPPAPQPAQPLA